MENLRFCLEFQCAGELLLHVLFAGCTIKNENGLLFSGRIFRRCYVVAAPYARLCLFTGAVALFGCGPLVALCNSRHS